MSSEYPQFEYTFTVLETHLDTFGHINNATYLQIFEEARWEMIHNRGYGLSKVHDSQIGPTILEINIKFKREIRVREEIKIHTQIQDVRSKTCRIGQKMINENGDVCTEIELVIGLFDMQRRCLISPTPEWQKAIGLMEA